MKVRQGWSGQVSANPDRWAKVDVEVDEDDLRRLVGAACSASVDLPVLLRVLPTGIVYALLEVEAEILVMTKLMVRYGYPPDQAQTKLDELRAQKRTVLDKVREIAK